ncbi:MAG: class I SAM-dependent methyltransferase [Bauldia litoralis]
MSHVYEGEKFERATSRDSLAKRLKINKAYASADFDGWLMSRLAVQQGEDVLDVGCGTGAQTSLFAKLVQPGGSVSAIDISAESIAALKDRLDDTDPVQAVAADMADLRSHIDGTFAVKQFDLAQSTYALYYAKEREVVLDVMKAALKPRGRLAVFTPQGPHGLVELAARFSTVPEPVYDSLRFGAEVLAPWFRAAFETVEEHHFHNRLSIPTADEVITFYRATTYYEASAEADIRTYVEAEIAGKGVFEYEKNGYLAIGRDRK